MNNVLEKKLKELENANDYECWYLVKQPTAFYSLCYLVSFLKKYKSVDVKNNLQDFISEELAKLLEVKPDLDISDNYRALRVAAFFGLIMMVSSKYDEAVITDTFDEITSRCSGNYEETEKYADIIQRQIEKMFISSQIDEQYNGVRQNYRLYPVMLLYKILTELGRATGKYQISMTEYRYLAATTTVFENFLDTLLQIKLLRMEPSSTVNNFEQYKAKFDNRLIQALKQLNTLIIDKNSISLNPDKLDEVAEKVFIFEQNPDIFTTDNYLGFLCSTRSLFELEKFKGENGENSTEIKETVDDRESRRLSSGVSALLYGIPGSGKSYTIEHEYRKPDTKTVRLVFYPDYTYSDFIGQILPNVSDGQVSYKFTPGPFTAIMRDAYNNPETEYLLIIEEINRGNAPAIFGEVFQLLERKDEINGDYDDGYPIGTSKYGIINTDIAAVMYGKERAEDEVRIPSNLSIIGTMNTSDQNVFTLDTAFHRRWEMRLIENSFDNAEFRFADALILDTGVTWKNFCTEINNIVVNNRIGMTAAEDKRLGVYFVHLGDLRFDERMGDLSTGEYDGLRKKESAGALTADEKNRLSEIRDAMKQNRRFPEKVIKYLWDDAFKFNRETAFESTEYKSLEQIIHDFMYSKGSERFKMFKDNVRNAFQGDNNNE
ncbi:MAG: AAA family ATPase [Ruminococcus sp.]|nr:AAA family ATPase [Ruminococcus sp.]MCM1380851.1 AAA family ATPase [Muribaculaceae bacterium]MCM1479077.1 AAA family ATPase [Muribaculaceae bacterium]